MSSRCNVYSGKKPYNFREYRTICVNIFHDLHDSHGSYANFERLKCTRLRKEDKIGDLGAARDSRRVEKRDGKRNLCEDTVNFLLQSRF